MPEINLGRVVGRDGITPNIQISGVETLNAGENAYFEREAGSPDSSPVFSVGIPRGASGGVPSIMVGDTETVAFEEGAEVTRREGSSDVEPVFDFKIPAGERGPQGFAPAENVQITYSMMLIPYYANKQILINSTNDITIFIQTAANAAMEDFAEVEIYRLGSGTVTIVPQDGVTLLCKESSYTITDQYTSVALKLLTAYDRSNNTWALQGAVG